MLKKFPDLHKTKLIIFITLSMLIIAGCGSDDPKQENTRKASKEVKINKSETMPAAKDEAVKAVDNNTVNEYTYDATGKPDPFVPLITELVPKKETRKKETSDGPITPLQKYNIEDLKLVAIVKSGNKLSALFEDMEEFGYIVNENTLIGNNGGIIKKITPDNVIIQEDIYNSSGVVEKSIRSIKIQSQE